MDSRPTSTLSADASRNIGWFIVLFGCCLIAGILIRLPALDYDYFCWDEHDYIAHNIYARETLGYFEIPYSNKWPLGHALIYLLTRAFSPFSIAPYRIATAVIDAASAALIGLIFYRRMGRIASLAVAPLYFLLASVCLRSSSGIIVENMANLPLIAALCVLVSTTRSSLIWAVSILFLELACLFKPTAVLPGLGLLGGQLWYRSKMPEASVRRDILQIMGWTAALMSILALLYWANFWNVQRYFWRSAVLYNTSGAVFGRRPLGQYADVLFAGFVFFQYLIPALVLGAIPLLNRTPQRAAESANLSSSAIGMMLGASASLLIRPAGGQTVYWLYLLPPLFCLAIIGYESIKSATDKPMTVALAAISILPLVYAWGLFIYGQPRNLAFGGRGGVRMVQSQVEEIIPAVRSVESHPNYKPQASRLLLWDVQWQFYYFARMIPASSILTKETWIFSVDRQWQQDELRKALSVSDFVVADKETLPGWLEDGLAKDFAMIFDGTRQRAYAKRPAQ